MFDNMISMEVRRGRTKHETGAEKLRDHRHESLQWDPLCLTKLSLNRSFGGGPRINELSGFRKASFCPAKETRLRQIRRRAACWGIVIGDSQPQEDPHATQELTTAVVSLKVPYFLELVLAEAGKGMI